MSNFIQDFEKRYYYNTEKEAKFLIQNDDILGGYIKKKDSIFYYISKNPIKFIIFEIIGQLIAVKVADKIFDRFCILCDNDFNVNNLLKISIEDMTKIGIWKNKAMYINEFVNFLVKNQNFFDELKGFDDDKAFKMLISIKGIGAWTAKMYLIFVLDRKDIFPFEDLALVKGVESFFNIKFKDKKILEKLGDKWKPYRSIATRYLYEYTSEVYNNMIQQ